MARSKSLLFTDVMIRKLKSVDKKYNRSEGNGFTVRVAPSGLKTWLYVYHFAGKRKEMTLGNYPDVTLEAARGKFEEARKKFKGGIDPLAEKTAAEEACRTAPTVADLVDEYLRKHAMVNKKSWKEDKRSLERDVLPLWGNRKAADIKKRDVVLLLEGIVERGAPIQANNTLEKVRKMFNFAVERDILEYAPCHGVKKPTKARYKDRILTDDEIVTFWNGLEEASMTDEMRRALKLILVTGQRPGEVISLNSRDIHEDWWTIQFSRAKNSRTHRVFMTPMAKDLIGEKNGFIFESPRGNKPMDSNAVAYAVRRNFKKGGNAQERCDDGAGEKIAMDPWTPHDLRRTVATNMSALGFPDEVVDAVINHVKKGVIAIYNRHRYDKEKQLALEAWERRLKTILGGSKGAKVIPMVRKVSADE